MLLHLVDVLPEDGSDPLTNATAIEAELEAYSSALVKRPIWTVLSKVDQLEDADLERIAEQFKAEFPDRPLYKVSALGDIGLPELTQAIMRFLDDYKDRREHDLDFAAEESQIEEAISEDVLRHSEEERARRRAQKDEQADDWDDDEMETVYVSE